MVCFTHTGIKTKEDPSIISEALRKVLRNSSVILGPIFMGGTDNVISAAVAISGLVHLCGLKTLLQLSQYLKWHLLSLPLWAYGDQWRFYLTWCAHRFEQDAWDRKRLAVTHLRPLEVSVGNHREAVFGCRHKKTSFTGDSSSSLSMWSRRFLRWWRSGGEEVSHKQKRLRAASHRVISRSVLSYLHCWVPGNLATMRKSTMLCTSICVKYQDGTSLFNSECVRNKAFFSLDFFPALTAEQERYPLDIGNDWWKTNNQ